MELYEKKVGNKINHKEKYVGRYQNNPNEERMLIDKENKLSG